MRRRTASCRIPPRFAAVPHPKRNILAYLSTLGLLMGFAAALLASVRLRSTLALAAAGFLLGTALFSRPFDTLLFAAPLAGWWLTAERSDRRWTTPPRSKLAGGRRRAAGRRHARVLPLATNSSFRLPLTLTDPSDTLGFGLRRLFPGQTPVDYSPLRAVEGAVRLASLTGVWNLWRVRPRRAGGGRLAPPPRAGTLAGAGRCHRARRTPVLLGQLRLDAVGRPLAVRPVLLAAGAGPCAILGASFRRIWCADRRVASGGMAAVSALVVVMAPAAHHPFTEGGRRFFAGVEQPASLVRSVVFVPPVQGPWLLQRRHGPHR